MPQDGTGSPRHAVKQLPRTSIPGNEECWLVILQRLRNPRLGNTGFHKLPPGPPPPQNPPSRPPKLALQISPQYYALL